MGRMEDALRKAAEERDRRKVADVAPAPPAPAPAPTPAPARAMAPEPPMTATVVEPVEQAPARVKAQSTPRTAAGSMSGAPAPARTATAVDERVITFHAPTDRRAEQFRALRASLLALNPSPVTILVTSGQRDEGKSLIAVNLAITLTEGGSRVLLVDANLRHPEVAGLVAVRPGPGTGELLAGVESNPVRLIQTSPVPGLDVLAAGTAGLSAVRVLAPRVLRDVLDAVRAPYRFVVVDSAAMADYADTALMAPDVDGVLVAVKIATGLKAATDKAVATLDAARARILGTVVLSAR